MVIKKQETKNPMGEAFMRKSSTRRFARYRTELPLIVKVLGQEGYLRVHGRCFEIAENGLGAVITSEFRAGEMVSLEFSIPNVTDLQVFRAVVRHRPPGTYRFLWVLSASAPLGAELFVEDLIHYNKRKPAFANRYPPFSCAGHY